ncbi:hypothetical protein T05_15794 [Trichinella murrelli]|uniref:Uncharacterized protein n=1 Tax=Trichinella murrelli TaxID=144512 RepID=A0A0V0UGH4_9BILA|nr:hypothetical protein T05_15794 [Trichinella murrelli]
MPTDIRLLLSNAIYNLLTLCVYSSKNGVACSVQTFVFSLLIRFALATNSGCYIVAMESPNTTRHYFLATSLQLAELNMRATRTSRPYNINGARLLKRICTNAKFSQSYNIVMKGVDLHDRLAAAYHLIYLNYVLCNNTKIVTLNYQIVAVLLDSEK